MKKILYSFLITVLFSSNVSAFEYPVGCFLTYGNGYFSKPCEELPSADAVSSGYNSQCEYNQAKQDYVAQNNSNGEIVGIVQYYLKKTQNSDMKYHQGDRISIIRDDGSQTIHDFFLTDITASDNFLLKASRICGDECPDLPFETEAGECGCGITERDSNRNGILDCKEADLDDGEEEETPETDNPEDSEPGDENYSGDPINIFTGSNYISKTDISFNSPYQRQFSFERRYNSRSAQNEALGYGWTHSYGVKLYPEINVEESIIKIRSSSGRGIFFQYDDNHFSGMYGEQSHVDVEGSLTIWKLTDGSSYTFDSTGLLQSVSDIYGNIQNLSYNANNLLEIVTDQASGRVLTFHYNSSEKIDHISGPVTDSVPGGIWVTYGYDSNDNLTSITYADGSGNTFQYDDPNDTHNITGMYDKESHFLNSWAYDASDRAYENIHRNGLGTTIDYLYDHEPIITTDTYGVSKTFTITKILGRKVITDIVSDSGQSIGGPGVVKYVYNANRYIEEKHYENGRIDKFQNLDSRGNPQTIITAFGTTNEKTVYATWHPVLNKKLSRSETSLLASGSHETIWDYDDDYNDTPNQAPTNKMSRLLEKGFTYDNTGAVVAYENITLYYYDTKGLITDIDGPLDGDQDKTTFTYDSATGDLLSVSNASGTTSFVHDSAGNTVSATDINNIVTTMTYDGKNRVLASTRDGKTTSKTFSLAGEISTVTDQELRSLTYTYETQYGRLDKVTDGLGNYNQYGYDAHGNVSQNYIYDNTDTLQKKSNFNFEGIDLPGKLWRQINFDDSYTEFGYDSAGNRTSVKSADNKTTSYIYDEFNRIKTVTQPGNVVTSYDYDINGNLKTITDANNKVTSYTYDDNGHLVKTISPDTGTNLYSYNKVGKLLTKTVNSGTVTSYTYDALGRLDGIQYADNTRDVTFTYDEGINGKGRLTGKTGFDYSYAYYYNTSGQIVTEEKTISTASYTTVYSYDNSGILTGTTYPDGRTVTYGLNSNGKYLSASTTKAATTNQLVSNAAYKPFGPNTGFDFGNGINHSKSFDLGYNVSGITAGNVQNLTYTPDPAGKITAITNNLDPSRNQTFVYDDLNRLESATGIYGTLDYTYDAVGNRETLTKNSETDTYNYLPGTNIIDTVSGEVSKTFTHNTNGNILTATNEQSEASPTGTTEFLYNNDGQRIKKTTGSLNIYYHYDLSGNLIAETDETGILVKAYIYMAGIRIASIAVDGTICYYHNNHLATPEVMTDKNGSIVWKADYLPFGKAEVDPASTVVNDFRFPGQIFDSETGYHYNWNRYYDAETGRYLTADPIGLRGGLNLYGYCMGDPVNAIDPMGLYLIIKLSKKLWGKVMPGIGPLKKGGVYKDPRIKVYGDAKAKNYLKTKIKPDGEVQSKIGLDVPKGAVKKAVDALEKFKYAAVPLIGEWFLDPFDADAAGEGSYIPDDYWDRYSDSEKKSDPCK